eukprot:1181524-Prorocentrum_minimum.AAC.2
MGPCSTHMVTGLGYGPNSGVAPETNGHCGYILSPLPQLVLRFRTSTRRLRWCEERDLRALTGRADWAVPGGRGQSGCLPGSSSVTSCPSTLPSPGSTFPVAPPPHPPPSSADLSGTPKSVAMLVRCVAVLCETFSRSECLRNQLLNVNEKGEGDYRTSGLQTLVRFLSCTNVTQRFTNVAPSYTRP